MDYPRLTDNEVAQYLSFLKLVSKGNVDLDRSKALDYGIRRFRKAYPGIPTPRITNDTDVGNVTLFIRRELEGTLGEELDRNPLILTMTPRKRKRDQRTPITSPTIKSPDAKIQRLQEENIFVSKVKIYLSSSE